MSIARASLIPPRNLAEVNERILSLEDLARQRRQDLMCAVRRIARLLGGQAADIPADPEVLRRSLMTLTPASAGMTKSRLGNVRALLAAALDLTGAKIVRGRRIIGLTPTWKGLLKRVPDPFERPRLSRFLSFASENGIAPQQVNDQTVSEFAETLKRNSLLDRHKQIVRSFCLAWNRCAEGVAGWPDTQLTVPNGRRWYALPASDYPLSFGADIEAYLAHLAGGDLFEETSRDPASGSTIRDVRFRVLQMAAALVHSGRAPASICTLADLVEPEAMKIALNFFWSRNGKRKTGQIHNFALTAIKIAKWWVKAPQEKIAALQAIRRQVDPKEKGMTARNRARLRQFDDPENLRRLIRLPDTILRDLPRSTPPSYNQAVRVQSALAVAILTSAPMRMRNLASLRLGQHIVQTRPGGARHIVIPPEEVKNKAALAFEVPDSVADILDVYLSRCRPRLATDLEGFLFPARRGGGKLPVQLAQQIKRLIRAGDRNRSQPARVSSSGGHVVSARPSGRVRDGSPASRPQGSQHDRRRLLRPRTGRRAPSLRRPSRASPQR